MVYSFVLRQSNVFFLVEQSALASKQSPVWAPQGWMFPTLSIARDMPIAPKQGLLVENG